MFDFPSALLNSEHTVTVASDTSYTAFSSGYYEATKNKAFFVMAITEESNVMLFQKPVEIKDLARRINAEVEQ